MRRDRVTSATMPVVPVMQLPLLSFAIDNDPELLPMALVAPAGSRFPLATVTALENTGYYRFVAPEVAAARADRVLTGRRVSFVATMTPGSSAVLLARKGAQVPVEADAADPRRPRARLRRRAPPRLGRSRASRDRHPPRPVPRSSSVAAIIPKD